MKTNKVDLAEGVDRMCKALQDECSNCKLSFMNNRFGDPCDMFVKEYPEEVSEIIDKWIKEEENGRS